MKVLVATERGQGSRKNDFAHATPGELVTFASECDGEPVDGACGCRRALGGVESHKATTTFTVEERPITLKDLTAALDKSLREGGWVDEGEDDAWAREDAREIARIAAAFPVGAVIERRGNNFKTRKV